MTVTAVLGGTFDPVHVGHIRHAEAVAERLDARVYLVPCSIPSHRPQPVASAADRLAMLELAVAGHDRLAVDDCELQREGTSYTMDTLRAYRARLGDTAPIVFVMGIDAYLTLPGWAEWQQLTGVAHLLVIDRPGEHPGKPAELARWEQDQVLAYEDVSLIRSRPAGTITHLALADIPVSASGIRENLGLGKGIQGLVPESVDRYIAGHGLYLSR